MDLQVERERAQAVMIVSGQLDADSAYEVYVRAAQLAEDGYSIVVFDLAQIDFIGSTGLGMLVRSRDELALNLESHLRIRRPRDRVTRMLALTALDDQFHVVS